MLAFNLASVASAREALETGAGCRWTQHWRERAHVAALERWIDGDIDGALAIWEEILAEHPRDCWPSACTISAPSGWAARTAWSASVDAAMPALVARACRAGAACSPAAASRTRKLGYYAIAEAAGRAAIALDPGDLWAAHGVAHVLEMQGRRSEGIAWLAGAGAELGGRQQPDAPPLVAPRRCIHLERREFDAGARPLRPPLPRPRLAGHPGAARPLHRRAERRLDAVPAGARRASPSATAGRELADKAEARIGDYLSAFTQPHWMMALAAAGRWDAAERLIDGMRAWRRRRGNTPQPPCCATARCRSAEALLARMPRATLRRGLRP